MRSLDLRSVVHEGVVFRRSAHRSILIMHSIKSDPFIFFSIYTLHKVTSITMIRIPIMRTKANKIHRHSTNGSDWNADCDYHKQFKDHYGFTFLVSCFDWAGRRRPLHTPRGAAVLQADPIANRNKPNDTMNCAANPASGYSVCKTAIKCCLFVLAAAQICSFGPFRLIVSCCTQPNLTPLQSFQPATRLS